MRIKQLVLFLWMGTREARRGLADSVDAKLVVNEVADEHVPRRVCDC